FAFSLGGEASLRSTVFNKDEISEEKKGEEKVRPVHQVLPLNKKIVKRDVYFYIILMNEGAKLIGAGAATIALAGAAVGIGHVFSSLINSGS
ncbi:hypothetical protein J0J37_22465, partial [Vibrio vulnificus]|uniref:hypothetical protein n=1 Tax=Vibrio vulnificus TaxID=672 RepID=UPI0019D425D6